MRRRIKYKRDKYGHIKGENDVQDKNPFGTLKRLEGEEQQEDEEENKQEQEESLTKISTKGLVNKTLEISIQSRKIVNQKKQQKRSMKS